MAVDDFVLFAEHIKEYHKGKTNAITASRLRSKFGKPRDIRKLVNKARKFGFLICSEDCGYYYASHPEDINATINRLSAQAKEHLEIVSALQSAKGEIHNE